MLQNCTKNLADVSKVLQPGQLRSEGKGSIHTFVVFFLLFFFYFFFFLKKPEKLCFQKREEEKEENALRFIASQSFFPNPKQGTMRHA